MTRQSRPAPSWPPGSPGATELKGCPLTRTPRRCLATQDLGREIPSPLAGRRSSRTAAPRLEVMDRLDRAGDRARGDQHRLGRMAVWTGRDGTVWRRLAVARASQHPVPGILQPDDDALHGLLGRADHRRRLAHLARAGRLGRSVMPCSISPRSGRTTPQTRPSLWPPSSWAACRKRWPTSRS